MKKQAKPPSIEISSITFLALRTGIINILLLVTRYKGWCFVITQCGCTILPVIANGNGLYSKLYVWRNHFHVEFDRRKFTIS